MSINTFHAKTNVSQLMLKDKLAVMLGNYALITYANVVVSGLSVYVLKGLFSLDELMPWFAFIFLFAMCRLWLHKCYFSKEENSTTGLVKWSRIFICSTFIASLPWCYAAWFFIQDTEPVYITFLMVTLIGMGAGAIGANGGYFPTFFCYAVPFMLVISIRVLSIDSVEYQILGYFFISLTVGFIEFARANQKAVEQGLALKYKNVSLVEQLEQNNQSLIEQIAKVKEANKQKSQFLAAASHDLRQPLQSLILFSEVLEHQIKDNDGRLTLDKINQSVNALSSLFNALLDVSRLDAGDIKANKESVALGPFLKKLQGSFKEQAETHQISLKVMNTKLTVQTDPMLLLRCLQNLIINAILHSHGSKILVGVRRQKQQVKIFVIDNGCGIAKAEQANIFKEYHQLNNPERDRQKGLGLGLSIVKRTAELLKHDLRLVSVEHKGTGFYLTLPRGLTTAAKPLLNTSLPQQLNNESILIIDDEKDIRVAMATLLEQWGTNVTMASGIEDIKKLIDSDFCPDAIISDYRLPGELTGAQLVEQFRCARGTTIPAMLVTGDTDPQRIAEARSSGLLLMHKPIKPAKLRMALNRILSKEKQLN